MFVRHYYVHILFFTIQIICLKLTLKYFRREINGRRAAISEVPAVVCIHSGEACVHI